MPVHDEDSGQFDALRARLAEAEETLRAIRHGEVDAVLVTGTSGEQVYTLQTADAPYRAVVEQMHEGAVTLTSTGEINYCNRRFAELVDMPLQQVIGGSIGPFLEVADRPSLTALIQDGAGKLRTRLLTRGGRSVDVYMSVSTIATADARYRLLIVTDVSALMHAQRESRLKDEFLAMLAHELRNPVGAIAGAVQLLGLADLRDQRAVRARDVAQRQVHLMARLLDDLLDVGRVVTGQIVLHRRPLDLAETVQSSVASSSAAQNVTGRIAVAAESVWVHADAMRLEQIVSNLVSNALKFTAPDHPIRISVTREDADAVLRVADEGLGIEPDVLSHVFDLFVQADCTLGRSQGGLGIGLTLVRRLVELHDGTVEASSGGKGRGATFTVRLPACAVGPRVPGDTQPEKRRPCTVLLVEDNADAREMYRMVLQAAGHEVYEAEDGAGALALFRETRPAVAIIDVGLPDIDGYEVARRVRSKPDGSDTKLIALTGYGSPQDRERSRTAGFDCHLTKPVQPEHLLREIEASVARLRNAQE